MLRTRICHLEGGVGYVQAVVAEDVLWSMVDMDLTKYLQQDSSLPMQTGDPFFRYAIVTDVTSEGHIRRHFVWTVHHALCDGCSILELLDDLSRRFQGEVALQRQPFELFIRSPLIRVDPLQEQHFWRRFLSGINPTSYPSLPQGFFHADPSSTLVRPITFDHHPPLGLTKALILRAAWAILLSHHTGTQDVVFGAINDGRNAAVPGIAKMTGPTINLVPIALHIDPKESLGSFFSRVRVQAAEMMAFEHTGIAKIRKYLTGEGSAAADFQNLLIIHPMEFREAGAPAVQKLGLEYVEHLGKTEQHSYPLVTSITLSADTALAFKVQYDEQVISTQHVHNLINQFQAVLTQLIKAGKDSLLESVSPLSKQDLAQIYEWNHTTPPIEEICIHRLFQEQVLKQPNAEAVCSLEQALTYAELDNISTALALRLINHGVGPETFVAVCFEKSIWTIVAIMAVFKAGGIYVPIDPAHPRDRVTEMIKMAQIKIAIVSFSTARVLEGLCDQLLTTHEPPLCFVTSLPECLPSSTAYMLFTSGSTGSPKAIMMPHSAMSTSILHHGAAFGAGPNWRTLQFSSHVFDISMEEFFVTLAFGGCICIISDYDRLNNLPGAITSLKANTAFLVPTVANLLFPEEVPTLKTIVLGGEPVPKETILRWADHVNLANCYGPSETTVYCSGNLNISADDHPADIGRSIGGTMWLVNPDNYNQLSAIGCVGEIAISGPILSKGYFGDKEKTESAFVPAPDWLRTHSPESPYMTLYRSADLARYNTDGTFHIVGRRDTQVKLRGFRIELGEIESQAMMHSAATAAFATLSTEGPCARQVVLVVTFNRSGLKNHSGFDITPLNEKQRLDPEINGNIEKLKLHLSLVLPEYMVPSQIFVLKSMPRLLSGKVDRKAIKSWVHQMTPEMYNELLEGSDASGVAEFIPGTPADTLRQIWSEVLNVPISQIGMETSFFSVGGDSIFAIQVTSKAKEIGLPVTVRGLITARTLGNLARFVEQSQPAAPLALEKLNGHQSTDDILLGYEHSLMSRLGDNPSSKIQDAYLLSPLQREILKQRAINPAVFVVSWQMEISSQTSQPVSLDKIVRAWKRVVRKYPIFRSIFLKDPAQRRPPVQVVLTNPEPSVARTFDEPLPQMDECFLPHRARFFQYGDKVAGRIDLDHLVLDGWSLKLIKIALLAAYDTDELQLSVEPPSYKSFITALRPDRVDADSKYWASAFRNQRPSSLYLPAHDSEPLPSPRKSIIHLPVLKARSLNAFSARNGITTASIFDAAWAQTLSIFTQSPDVCFEYVVSGRDQELPGVFDIVGPLFNVLAYHLRGISTEITELAHLAHRIQEQRIQDSQYISCNIREVLESNMVIGKPFNTALNFQRRPKAVWTDHLRIDEDLSKSIDPWHVSFLYD